MDQPKPPNRNERPCFRSILDCATVFGGWEELSGKSRINSRMFHFDIIPSGSEGWRPVWGGWEASPRDDQVCRRDAVPLAVEWWYDFPELGGIWESDWLIEEMRNGRRS